MGPGVALHGGIGEVVVTGLVGIMWAGMVGLWVVFGVAAWKMMRAHERIAKTLQRVADTLESRQP